MKRCAAALVAVLAILVTAGCTDTDEPVKPEPSTSRVPVSMTYDEAYRALPMDGTEKLPISWDLSQVQDTDEVLAARRSLVFLYWERSQTDWTPIIPIGRFLYTDDLYQLTLAPFADVTDNEDPATGPLWVKTMGVEMVGTDRATVTFCTDTGYWRRASDEPQVRKDRAILESYEMHYVQAGDGERRWLADRYFAKDVKRGPKYGAECTKWAQHQP